MCVCDNQEGSIVIIFQDVNKVFLDSDLYWSFKKTLALWSNNFIYRIFSWKNSQELHEVSSHKEDLNAGCFLWW